MAIETVTAYRTSSGQCCLDKAAAYHEEMVALLKALPEVGRKGFGLAAFQEALAGVSAIAVRLEGLRSDLDEEADRKILAGLNKLADALGGWLKQARALASQMAGEKDPEVSKKVQGQE